MLGYIKIILSDFFSLLRVAGPVLALRWLSKVAICLGACRRAGNLQPADIAMGEGPFKVRLRESRALLVGRQVVSGMREIWARDVYTGGGFLSLKGLETVVDLGANMGNFTALALGSGPDTRVVSVEANEKNLPLLRRTISVNQADSRVMVFQKFIGGNTEYQVNLSQKEGKHTQAISVQDFIEEAKLTRIDLLKCDIEGSEFELLTPTSPLLAITRQLAIELHPPAGDCKAFIAMLQEVGFETQADYHAPTYLVRARRKL